MFRVDLCARFQACSKESHLIAVKKIFRYFIGMQKCGFESLFRGFDFFLEMLNGSWPVRLTRLTKKFIGLGLQYFWFEKI